MLLLRACPRCRGAILDYKIPTGDSPLCITCGWRGVNIPTDVRTEVLTHLGRPCVSPTSAGRRIGTGKPPLSGWERRTLRREVERAGSPSIARAS